jgi:hypothetical protein
MKRIRHDRERWQPPTPVLPVAVFHCRRCQAILTRSLTLLTDAAMLSQREGTSLVPPGCYWLVPSDQDFAGAFAVALADLVGVGYHPDTRRLLGCCGPSGSDGRNRICGCGYEVGTERSDCIWPHATYLDPVQVVAAAPDA